MARYTGEGRLIDTVRDNPLPLALMGLGIGWLVFSGMREGRAVRGGAHSGGRAGMGYGRPQGEDYDAGAGYGAYDSSDYGGADYAGYSSYAASGQGAAEAGEGRGRARGIREEAGVKARRMRESAARVTGRIQERAQDLAGSARTRLSGAGRSIRAGAGNLAGRSGDTYRDHPLMIGSVALLIGAALGAALPRTRQEDEMLGHGSDALAHRARAVGEDALGRAKQVARRTAEAARESGGEAFEHVRETAKESAREGFEHVKETAREETDKQTGGEAGRLH